MREVVNALEGHAGEMNENLDTAASIIQRKAEQALEYGEDSRVYNLRRGELRRHIEELEDIYQESKAIVELGKHLDIVYTSYERDEEVRLAKEKWNESSLKNPYTGPIGEAMDAHMDRVVEAKNTEILSHATPIQELQNTVKTYEILLYRVGENIEGIDPDTPFDPQKNDSELMDEHPEEKSDEPVDLSEDLFSKMF